LTPTRLSYAATRSLRTARLQVLAKLGLPPKESPMTKAKPKGLYANIHAKQERIKEGSGEHMRKPGSAGAPSDASFRQAAKTEKSEKKAKPRSAGKKA
jgi:hypothetical protein